jgi:hypothetical protein
METEDKSDFPDILVVTATGISWGDRMGRLNPMEKTIEM